jgi:multidrug efflux system membrane fusion protein
MASGCAALLLGVALSFSASRADKPSAPPVASAPAVPVVAAAVESGNVPIYQRGIGSVDAWNTVVVRSQIQGPLIRIAFKEGQIVHEGDLLAEIDPAPIRWRSSTLGFRRCGRCCCCSHSFLSPSSPFEAW